MITTPRVLINCSNLHHGGGVAVATSFLDCLSCLDHADLRISVLMSTSVERNLSELRTDLSRFECVLTRNFFGLDALFGGLDVHFVGFDIVFTVFGPAYFFRRNTLHLFGFAQPNIVYPKNLYSSNLGHIKSLLNRCKFELQAFFFSRADALVVELEHVKDGLVKRRLFRDMPVHVVYSSVHTIFYNKELWAPLSLPMSGNKIKLGVVSRNYPHKNLVVLPAVKRHLLEHFHMDVDIFVTFSAEEWRGCDDYFRNNVINLGGLTLSQCPTFYSLLDGVVFPSLLECFSAVPIEAMISGRRLFASDLPFIHDVCDTHCDYFDPLDPYNIAFVIDRHFRLSALQRKKMCDEAKMYSVRFPSPVDRASHYMALIQKQLELS